jgi:hypothetical protein
VSWSEYERGGCQARLRLFSLGTGDLGRRARRFLGTEVLREALTSGVRTTGHRFWSQSTPKMTERNSGRKLLESNGGEIEAREPADNKTENPLQVDNSQRVPGGLFGIDQEVVTLRGLSRQLPGLGLDCLGDVPRMKALARPTRFLHPYSPASVRAVAPARWRSDQSPEPRLEQPALSLSHLTWS